MNNLGANDNRSQTVGIFVTTRIPWVSQEVKAYMNWLELKAVFLHSLTELWKAQTHLQYSDVPSRPNDALLVSNIDDVELKTL